MSGFGLGDIVYIMVKPPGEALVDPSGCGFGEIKGFIPLHNKYEVEEYIMGGNREPLTNQMYSQDALHLCNNEESIVINSYLLGAVEA